MTFRRRPEYHDYWQAECPGWPDVIGYGATIPEACRSLLDTLVLRLLSERPKQEDTA